MLLIYSLVAEVSDAVSQILSEVLYRNQNAICSSWYWSLAALRVISYLLLLINLLAIWTFLTVLAHTKLMMEHEAPRL